MESYVFELIKSILVVCGIGVILAFLLEVAYFFLGDYGERHIFINKEGRLSVKHWKQIPLLCKMSSDTKW